MTSAPRLSLKDLRSFVVTKPTPRRAATRTTANPTRPTPMLLAGNRHAPQTTPTAAPAGNLVWTADKPLRTVEVTTTGKVVIGTVLRYLGDKDFGFAQVTIDGKIEQVFFHKKTAVKVLGTADSPQLTNTRVWPIGGDITPKTKIVMHLGHTDKGLRAVNWGICPKTHDWRPDMVDTFTMQDFVGGFVSVYPNDGSWGDNRYTGWLDKITMSPTEMNFVMIGAQRFDPAADKYVMCDRPVTQSYSLARVTIEVDTNPKHSRDAIIFVIQGLWDLEQVIIFEMPAKRPKAAAN